MAKILLLFHALSSGEYSYAGMEKMLIWLGNSLAEENNDVTFCTLYDRIPSEKYSAKVKSIELGIPYYSNFFKRNVFLFRKALCRLNEIFSKHHYDYVVNFGDTAFFLALFLKVRFPFSLITSERGDPFHNNGFTDKLRRKLMRYSSRVIFQTQGARAFYSNISSQKSCIIPNPVIIPSKQWNYWDTDDHICYLGRLEFTQKRIDILLKAFQEVLTVYPKYVLDMYGTGEIVKATALCETLGITANVVFHGAIDNINECLSKSRVFVLTSDYEGIPNALLEAMSLGMPVVSTDCSPGGAALVIDNNKNGLIVSCGEYHKVSEAICYLIGHPQESMRMGDLARKSMSLYSEKEILKLWKTVFHQ